MKGGILLALEGNILIITYYFGIKVRHVQMVYSM